MAKIQHEAADLSDPKVAYAHGLKRVGNKLVTDSPKATLVYTLSDAQLKAYEKRENGGGK